MTTNAKLVKCVAIALTACLFAVNGALAETPQTPPGGQGGDETPPTGVIYFQYQSQVWTMNADGSGVQEIASGSARHSVFLPFWSPTGSHLLYHEGDYRLSESNIIRANPDGGARTKLTQDIFGDGYSQVAISWR